MNSVLSHLLAGALGVGVGSGLVRAFTLPRRQANGLATVADKIDPGAHITGAQVQAANVALVEELVGHAQEQEAGKQ